MLMLNNDIFEDDVLRIADEAITLFAASIGTLNTSISNMIHLLIKNPECVSTIRQEIKELNHNSGVYGLEELNSMKYMNNCFHESLRLWTPTGLSF
jgi:cytochrome P450